MSSDVVLDPKQVTVSIATFIAAAAFVLGVFGSWLTFSITMSHRVDNLEKQEVAHTEWQRQIAQTLDQMRDDLRELRAVKGLGQTAFRLWVAETRAANPDLALPDAPQ